MKKIQSFKIRDTLVHTLQLTRRLAYSGDRTYFVFIIVDSSLYRLYLHASCSIRGGVLSILLRCFLYSLFSVAVRICDPLKTPLCILALDLTEDKAHYEVQVELLTEGLDCIVFVFKEVGKHTSLLMKIQDVTPPLL